MKIEANIWDADLIQEMIGTPQCPYQIKSAYKILFRIKSEGPTGAREDDRRPVMQENGPMRFRVTIAMS